MTQEKKTMSPWLRVLAALAALAVLGGSLFFMLSPGSGRSASRLPGIAAAQAEEWKTMKKGDSGKEIRVAQEALKKLQYYEGKVDGNFSKALEAAVLAFQEDFGLKKTGTLDWDTYSLLAEEQGEPLPDNPAAQSPDATAPPQEEEQFVVYGGEYSDKDHVAAYLKAFKELPPNYITKKQAQALGWENTLGNLWQVAPGKSIGGDNFGNYEGLLPKAQGRKYFECDIDYDLDREKYRGGRNGKRIIFSNDGLIFYTEDHYKTFEEIK